MSPPRGMADGVVFDLDGTLADTQADIANSMNGVLGRAGLPTHPVDAYRHFVGDGVDAMVERAAGGLAGSAAVELKEAFREHYVQHLLDETVPYEGATELLVALGRQGIALAVLSNKPQAMTARIVETLFGQVSFRAVRGQRPDVPKKPDPTALLEIVTALGVPAQRCAMVGDTAVDMGCALAAGTLAVGATWGFRGRTELERAGARYLIDQPADLVALVCADHPIG